MREQVWVSVQDDRIRNPRVKVTSSNRGCVQGQALAGPVVGEGVPP